MNGEWSLDALYKGYDDPNFREDLKKLAGQTEGLKRLADNLPNPGGKEDVLDAVGKLEEFAVSFYNLYAYLALRQSTNTTDPQTSSYMEQVLRLEGESAADVIRIEKFLAAVQDLDLMIKGEDKLAQYRFYFTELRQKSAHRMSDDAEEMFALMNLSGGKAWSNLYDYLTSTVEVDYHGEKINLSSVRNLAYSEDPAVRKEAYEAELASYEKIKSPIAFSLNNIKSQVNMIAKKRNYATPLEMTLEKSRMKKETLDALWTACVEAFPVFHRYLKAKAEYLGYKNGLPWYELFAPLGRSSRKFDLDGAKEFLLKHFGKFAPDLAAMVKEAFEKEWIDFYPHSGKVGGAFCENLPFHKQSRVLTNFDGQLGDVVTLAHELGHAYHGMMIQDHLPLNTEYSMPVAETASTFNENIITNAAIAEAEGIEKLALIENQLQDLTQVICDIYSRFLFESAVFEKRETGFLFADELKEIMLDAQKQAYGDGLDPEYMHPYMWTCKGHYYSENLSFYNFPYAFGGLFSKGLYAQYQKEGEAFLPKYRELLKATTVSTVEEVAMIAGIDLTKPDFWRESLKLAEASVEEFIALTKQYPAEN